MDRAYLEKKFRYLTGTDLDVLLEQADNGYTDIMQVASEMNEMRKRCSATQAVENRNFYSETEELGLQSLLSHYRYLTKSDLEVLTSEANRTSKQELMMIASQMNEMRYKCSFAQDEEDRDCFSATNSPEHQRLISFYCFTFINEWHKDIRVYPEYNLNNLRGLSSKLSKGYSPDITVTDANDYPIFFIEIEDNKFNRLTNSTKKKIEKCFEMINCLETVYVVYNVNNKAYYRKWEYGECVMPKKKDKLPGTRLDELVDMATKMVLY